MQPPYDFNEPPMSGDVPLPKSPANCRVYERISIDGVMFRSPIGRGWTKTPLKHPVIAETLLGVIEIVNLPPAEGGALPVSSPDDSYQAAPSTTTPICHHLSDCDVYVPH